jgi:hypothetical protein
VRLEEELIARSEKKNERLLAAEDADTPLYKENERRRETGRLEEQRRNNHPAADVEENECEGESSTLACDALPNKSEVPALYDRSEIL